jgi:ATP-dependent Lon protease
VSLCRIEIGCAAGTGKLKVAGGIEGNTRESIQRAFGFLQSSKVRLGVAHDFDTTDFHVEAIDLLQNQVACECGVAFIVAVLSALRKIPVQPALVILGDASIQGNIKGLRTLVEPCQLAMENGAKRALVPIENRRQFLEVSGDVAERMDPIFYSDAPLAANKALALG